MNTIKKKDWRLELYKLFSANPYLKEPDYTSLLRDSIEKMNMPSVSSIQKELVNLRKARRKEIEHPGIDATWHIGTLKEHSLSPGGVAKIMEWIVKGSKVRPDLHLPTIRTALWMDRLSALPVSITVLHRISLFYGIAEKISELSGKQYSFTGAVPDDVLIETLSDPQKCLIESFNEGFDEATPEQVNKILDDIEASYIKSILKDGE